MINTITDALIGQYDKNKKYDFLNKMRNHDNLKKLNENKRDELLDHCLGLINVFEDDYLEYGDDPYIEILVSPDGERYMSFVNDADWQTREYYKMLHWSYLYSFRISEIYED